MREISPAHAQQHPMNNAGVDRTFAQTTFGPPPVNRTPVNPGRAGNAVFRPSMDFSVPTSAAREARGRGANDAIQDSSRCSPLSVLKPSPHQINARQCHGRDISPKPCAVHPHGLTWIRNSVPGRLLTYAIGEGMMSRESRD
jgi:hypothetical protein